MIAVDVTARETSLTTLIGANTRYFLRSRGATSYIIDNGVAFVDVDEPMRAECLIDTTTLDGEYELFISFDALPQIPRLGPYRINVNA